MTAAGTGSSTRSDGAGPLVRAAVDLHAHYLSPAYRKAALAAGQQHPDGMPALPDWSVEQALATMDSVGIAAAALSVSSPGLAFETDGPARTALARTVNDEGAAAVAARPDRLALMATLPLPDVDAAVAEVDRCYDELHVDGVGLHTHYDGVYLGDTRLDPVLAALDARAALVTIHPVSPCGFESVSFGRPRPMVEFLLDTTRTVVNLVLSGALRRYPGIRWVVPHAGAALPVLADRVHRFAGLLLPPEEDVDVLEALAGLYYDLAGMPVPRGLAALLTLVGPDQLVYGSDYPFTPAGTVSDLAGELVGPGGLTRSQQPAALRENALRLLPRLASVVR